MKKALFLICSAFIIHAVHAQIVIEAKDMPVAGETFRRSTVDLLSYQTLVTYPTILADTGANKTWDFSYLTTATESVDKYQTATQVSPLYAFLISPDAYGFKVLDTLKLPDSLLPVSITNVYSFYEMKTNPDRFESVALGVSASGFPVPSVYSDPDEIFWLPLIYQDVNFSTFKTEIGLPGSFQLIQKGTRTTTMDSWGTVITPFFHTPQNCLRTRAVIDEVDTLTINSTSIPIPRTTVEYKWMIKGIHYPAVQITSSIILGVELITNIQFLDSTSGTLSVTPVVNSSPSPQGISAHPNPLVNGTTEIDVPKDWTTYVISVFNMNGKLQKNYTNKNHINISELNEGQYIIRVISGSNVSYFKIVK